MSTIASLIGLIDPSAIKPWYEGQQGVNREQIGRQQAQTGLIELQRLKQSQASEEEVMAFYREHPELLVGGGSVLGSLGPAGGPPGGMPAPPPGAITQSPLGGGPAQQMPAYPDASRYAGVSPQGGGPIPPDVLAQTMPTVTPPQGGSVLGSLGPQGGMPGPQQPGRNPLLEMAARDPRAALMLYDRQTKMQEQHLDMGTKIAGSVARIVQGVTDQASLDKAREEISLFDQRAAAQLPQFYSKEALEPFIKRAFTAQETAEVRLKTWQQQNEERKNQLEEMKIGVQLTNAGYQGLGTDVTSILRGLTDEQVKQFGGRTSPQAIAYATEEEKKRKLGQAQATEIQRGQTERELRGEKTLSETMGTKATNLFDTQTLEPVDTRMKQKDYEALPAGQVRELSPQLTEQITNIRTSVPIIAQLQGHIDKIYGPGGVLARMTPDERADLAAVPGRWAKQYAQKYPEVALAQRFINSNSGALARALAGEKGAMAEGDVSRAKEMLPNLETTLKVWPPANIGIQSPDTRVVALGTMNSIVDMINGRVRTILGNEQFSHPKLHRYQTAEEAQTAAGGTVTPPAVAPPELPIPPTVGLNPNLRPLPPTFGPGDPTQQLRPQAPPPAPPVQPTPPTATSTPSNDEAYRRLMQGKLPVPGKQSQVQTGRRGVELARASGIKVMDRQDIAEAVQQTGKTPQEVIAAARAKGYRVYTGGTAMV